jgi:hypothetical protein
MTKCKYNEGIVYIIEDEVDSSHQEATSDDEQNIRCIFDRSPFNDGSCLAWRKPCFHEEDDAGERNKVEEPQNSDCPAEPDLWQQLPNNDRIQDPTNRVARRHYPKGHSTLLDKVG